jgi:hypothetical protein
MFSSGVTDEYAWFSVDLYNSYQLTDVEVWLASGLVAPPYATVAVYVSAAPLRANGTMASRPFPAPCFNSSFSVTPPSDGYFSGACLANGRYITVQFVPLGGRAAVLRFCALQAFGSLSSVHPPLAASPPKADSIVRIAVPVALGGAAFAVVAWMLLRRCAASPAAKLLFPSDFSPEAPLTRAELLLQQAA